MSYLYNNLNGEPFLFRYILVQSTVFIYYIMKQNLLFRINSNYIYTKHQKVHELCLGHTNTDTLLVFVVIVSILKTKL